MTRAYVYAMLPSLASSFKISTMGDVIGTMQLLATCQKAPSLAHQERILVLDVMLQRRQPDTRGDP